MRKVWKAGFWRRRSPIVRNDGLHSLNSMMAGDVVWFTEAEWVEATGEILIF
jgi:hypothetical protein